MERSCRKPCSIHDHIPDSRRYISSPDFDIVKCFEQSDINERKAAEDQFMTDVFTIDRWMPSPTQQWAKTQIQNNFLVRMILVQTAFRIQIDVILDFKIKTP